MASGTPPRADVGSHEAEEAAEDGELTGLVLAGHSLGRVLGRGAFGVVYLAQQLATSTQVAVKVMSRRALQSKKEFVRVGGRMTVATAYDKVRRELAIMRKVSHTHVVRCIDILEDPSDDRIFLVLEFATGGEAMSWSDQPAQALQAGYGMHAEAALAARAGGDGNEAGLSSSGGDGEVGGDGAGPAATATATVGGGAPESGCYYSKALLRKTERARVTYTLLECQCIMRDILRGLSYLHRHGIVHRDIKPPNILLKEVAPPSGAAIAAATGAGSRLSPRGGGVSPSFPFIAMLADLGVSHMYEPGAPDDLLRKTEGTPAFHSPEAAAGGAFSGKASDMWAMGACMYAFLTGSLPYMPVMGETQPLLYERIRHSPVNFERLYDSIAMQQVLAQLRAVAPQRDAAARSRYYELLSDIACAMDFIALLLQKDVAARATVDEALAHPWLNPPLRNAGGMLAPPNLVATATASAATGAGLTATGAPMLLPPAEAVVEAIVDAWRTRLGIDVPSPAIDSPLHAVAANGPAGDAHSWSLGSGAAAAIGLQELAALPTPRPGASAQDVYDATGIADDAASVSSMGSRGGRSVSLGSGIGDGSSVASGTQTGRHDSDSVLGDSYSVVAARGLPPPPPTLTASAASGAMSTGGSSSAAAPVGGLLTSSGSSRTAARSAAGGSLVQSSVVGGASRLTAREFQETLQSMSDETLASGAALTMSMPTRLPAAAPPAAVNAGAGRSASPVVSGALASATASGTSPARRGVAFADTVTADHVMGASSGATPLVAMRYQTHNGAPGSVGSGSVPVSPSSSPLMFGAAGTASPHGMAPAVRPLSLRVPVPLPGMHATASSGGAGTANGYERDSDNASTGSGGQSSAAGSGGSGDRAASPGSGVVDEYARLAHETGGFVTISLPISALVPALAAPQTERMSTVVDGATAFAAGDPLDVSEEDLSRAVVRLVLAKGERRRSLAAGSSLEAFAAAGAGGAGGDGGMSGRRTPGSPGRKATGIAALPGLRRLESLNAMGDGITDGSDRAVRPSMEPLGDAVKVGLVMSMSRLKAMVHHLVVAFKFRLITKQLRRDRDAALEAAGGVPVAAPSELRSHSGDGSVPALVSDLIAAASGTLAPVGGRQSPSDGTGRAAAGARAVSTPSNDSDTAPVPLKPRSISVLSRGSAASAAVEPSSPMQVQVASRGSLTPAMGLPGRGSPSASIASAFSAPGATQPSWLAASAASGAHDAAAGEAAAPIAAQPLSPSTVDTALPVATRRVEPAAQRHSAAEDATLTLMATSDAAAPPVELDSYDTPAEASFAATLRARFPFPAAHLVLPPTSRFHAAVASLPPAAGAASPAGTEATRAGELATAARQPLLARLIERGWTPPDVGSVMRRMRVHDGDIAAAAVAAAAVISPPRSAPSEGRAGGRDTTAAARAALGDSTASPPKPEWVQPWIRGKDQRSPGSPATKPASPRPASPRGAILATPPPPAPMAMRSGGATRSSDGMSPGVAGGDAPRMPPAVVASSPMYRRLRAGLMHPVASPTSHPAAAAPAPGAASPRARVAGDGRTTAPRAGAAAPASPSVAERHASGATETGGRGESKQRFLAAVFAGTHLDPHLIGHPAVARHYAPSPKTYAAPATSDAGGSDGARIAGR